MKELIAICIFTLLINVILVLFCYAMSDLED
jgi:hypothetical protein